MEIVEYVEYVVIVFYHFGTPIFERTAYHVSHQLLFVPENIDMVNQGLSVSLVKLNE